MTASILLHSSKLVNMFKMKVYAIIAETFGHMMSVETYELGWKDIRSNVNICFYATSGFCPYTTWLQENISKHSGEEEKARNLQWYICMTLVRLDLPANIGQEDFDLHPRPPRCL